MRCVEPPAALLVVGSVVSVQVGQAFGKLLFPTVGPAGVAALRLGFAAAIMLVWWRPALPRTRSSVALVLGYGLAIAGMNLVYPALAWLPLAVASGLQLLGPIVVALVGSRHVLQVVWAVLAAVAIGAFVVDGSTSAARGAGVALALASAVAMGAYLLLGRRAAARSLDGSMLAVAVAVAAVLWLPAGIVENGTALVQPVSLGAGLGVAVLSAAVPYSLDLAALRRLPPRTVGVLESLEPVVAAAAGIVVLGELPTPVRWAGIVCVTVASLGAVRSRHVSRMS